MLFDRNANRGAVYPRCTQLNARHACCGVIRHAELQSILTDGVQWFCPAFVTPCSEKPD